MARPKRTSGSRDEAKPRTVQVRLPGGELVTHTAAGPIRWAVAVTDNGGWRIPPSNWYPTKAKAEEAARAEYRRWARMATRGRTGQTVQGWMQAQGAFYGKGARERYARILPAKDITPAPARAPKKAARPKRKRKAESGYFVEHCSIKVRKFKTLKEAQAAANGAPFTRIRDASGVYVGKGG